jgi:hypothetical protein
MCISWDIDYLSRVILVLLGPIVDALLTEEIPATCALFWIPSNVGTHGAIEHISRKVGKAIFIVSVLAHFVDFKL